LKNFDNRTIKQIFFDVGNVLLTFSGALENLSKNLDLPLSVCQKVWQNSEHDLCSGKYKPQELWNRLRQKSKYSGVDIDLPSFWVDHRIPILDMHLLTQQLFAHYQVGIFSNLYLGIFNQLIINEKIPNLKYTTAIISCNFGIVKPDPKLFLIAQQTANVKPSEILLIDDNQQVIDTAIRLNWQTFIFDTKKPQSSISKLKKQLLCTQY
jgi:FMN phosphatase YigB (HAD superfamily)